MDHPDIIVCRADLKNVGGFDFLKEWANYV